MSEAKDPVKVPFSKFQDKPGAKPEEQVELCKDGVGRISVPKSREASHRQRGFLSPKEYAAMLEKRGFDGVDPTAKHGAATAELPATDAAALESPVEKRTPRRGPGPVSTEGSEG